jgi:hypothetical protein
MTHSFIATGFPAISVHVRADLLGINIENNEWQIRLASIAFHDATVTMNKLFSLTTNLVKCPKCVECAGAGGFLCQQCLERGRGESKEMPIFFGICNISSFDSLQHEQNISQTWYDVTNKVKNITFSLRDITTDHPFDITTNCKFSVYIEMRQK